METSTTPLPRANSSLSVPPTLQHMEQVPHSASHAPKIRIVKLSYIVYGHPNLAEITTFLHDFGMTIAHATDSKIYFRGTGPDPYVYIAVKASEKQFLGGAFEVESYRDLEKISELPGGEAIVELKDLPGGGFTTMIRDPEGFPINFIYGQTLCPTSESHMLPEAAPLIINHPTEKLRKGLFQRFSHGPAPVHKLGHFGLCTTNFPSLLSFYTENFNLTPSDVLYDEDGNDVLAFLHIDRGEEWVDHHCFFVMQARGEGHVHHASFEVKDIDTQFLGHRWLQSKGYRTAWGVGRHVLGYVLL
jgi:Glyoxalase/Bleomycin resistance protein/Dioxygenase superfamily